jgi:TolB-like protein/lipoprotein NlpI
LFLAVCATARLEGQCPDGTPPPCARPARIAAPPPNSVAVLYFDVRDTSDAYLADGLTEEISTSLGRVGRLAVKVPSAVRRAQRASGDDVRALGRALGVHWVVDGSLRRSGSQLRVDVRLVDASSETAAWSQAFTRATTDLLAIEADIAREVATGIAGTLAPEERSTLARPAVNPQAHDWVLRGNFHLAQRTQQSALRAVAEYEEAIRLDPRYADAYGHLADAYSLFHNWSWQYPGLGTDSLLARAEAAARRALAIDSSSAVAWLAEGSVRMERFGLTMDGVVEALGRSIALDPRQPEAFHLLGIALVLLGNDSAGVGALLHALSLDPERAITLSWLGIERFHERRYAEARRWYDSALAVAPSFPLALSRRAVARMFLGDTAGAVADARDGVRASRGDTLLALSMLAYVEAVTGDGAAARRHVRAVAAARDIVEEATARAAAALAAAGDKAGALDLLEQARRNAFLRYYLGNPEMDALRSEPRFQRLAAELQAP